MTDNLGAEVSEMLRNPDLTVDQRGIMLTAYTLTCIHELLREIRDMLKAKP